MVRRTGLGWPGRASRRDLFGSQHVANNLINEASGTAPHKAHAGSAPTHSPLTSRDLDVIGTVPKSPFPLHCGTVALHQ